MTLALSTPFERSLVRETTLEDLDLEAVYTYLVKRAPRLLKQFSPEQAMERVGLIARSGTSLAPTVAGLLLFGFQPQLLHPEWGQVAVRVKGQMLTDSVLEREDIEGSIPHMITATLAFVRAHTTALQNELELAETAEEYPIVAVREALVNALVHRDWNMTGRTALRIFDDRLEIWNPGGPLSILGLSLEELSGVGGVSLPRNPLIAATCRAMGFGEQLGRGLPTMRRSTTGIAGESVTITNTKTEVTISIPSALHVRRRIS